MPVRPSVNQFSLTVLRGREGRQSNFVSVPLFVSFTLTPGVFDRSSLYEDAVRQDLTTVFFFKLC